MKLNDYANKEMYKFMKELIDSINNRDNEIFYMNHKIIYDDKYNTIIFINDGDNCYKIEVIPKDKDNYNRHLEMEIYPKTLLRPYYNIKYSDETIFVAELDKENEEIVVVRHIDILSNNVLIGIMEGLLSMNRNEFLKKKEYIHINEKDLYDYIEKVMYKNYKGDVKDEKEL